MFDKLKSKNEDVFPWLKARVKPYIPRILLLTLFNGINAFLTAATAYISKYLIDSAVGRDREGLIRFAIISAAVTMFIIMLRMSVNLVNSKLEIDMERDFRSYFIANLFDKDYLTITSYHSGDLMTRLTNDNNCIIGGLISILPNLVGLVLRIVFAFVALFLLDRRLAIIFGCFGIVVFFVTRLSRGYLKDFYHRNQKSESAVRSFAQEIIENLLVVSVFDAAPEVNAQADKLLEKNADNRWKRTKFFTFGTGGLSIVFRVAYITVVIVCAFKLLAGTISYGSITAILNLIGQLQSPFKSLSGLLPTYYQMIASTERVLEILEIKNESKTEKIDADEFYSKLESIDFNDITFSYGRDEVLKDTSVSVKKGDFVAVTGISGIGKSTMLKMMLSVIFPESGEVIFKTEDGEEHPDTSHRPLFSYVPQGNMLLSGTIRDNVTFMNQGKTDEDFINELPDGLDTVIGERGRGLSEGQVQRLAIARAILHGAPVILLDEATSALDEATEERVLKNLKSLGDCTCVIVSHKRAALKVCSKEIQISDKKFILKELDNEA